MAKDKDGMPPGVRGPRGPKRPQQSQRVQPQQRPSQQASSGRSSFERRSMPLLAWMHALPRWLIVVIPGILLFLGLVLTGSFAWLGGLLLLLLGVFLGWLTALSWPALAPASRMLRALVVLAVFGIGVLKLLGRF